MVTAGLWLVALEAFAISALLPPALITENERLYRTLIIGTGLAVVAGCAGLGLIFAGLVVAVL